MYARQALYQQAPPPATRDSDSDNATQVALAQHLNNFESNFPNFIFNPHKLLLSDPKNCLLRGTGASANAKDLCLPTLNPLLFSSHQLLR